jgi:predicted anti-sigma-YlaC factor YlaD
LRNREPRNRPGARIDYLSVRCATAREAISALLDDEDPGVDRVELDAHLLGCVECRRWHAAAHEVTRNARLEPARATTVSADALVVAVLTRSRLPRRPALVTWVRAALVVVAAAQAWTTVPMLLSGHDHTAPAHIAHEVGAFAMALAIGFVVAAWRPERAYGMQMVVGAVAVLLVFTSTLDVLRGRTDLGDEAPHLLAVAGWLLLISLARVTPSRTVGPGRSLVPVARAFGSRRSAAGGLDLDEPISKAGGSAASGRRRAG